MIPDLLRLGGGSVAAFVSLLMLRAGLHKAGGQSDFQGVLADYGLVPDVALRPLGAILPGLELLAAAALCLGEVRSIGVLLATGLLLVYASAMAMALARGRTEIDCGCGGPPSPLGWSLVARNLALALALVPAGIGAGNWRTVKEAGVEWGVAVIAMTCWIACEHATANHRRMHADRTPPGAALFGGRA